MNWRRLIFIIFALCVTQGMKQYRSKLGPLPKPILDVNVYWGPGSPTASDTSIRPFEIDYGMEVIEEIREKLSEKALAKLREPLEGTAFEYGTNTDYLKTVLAYWRDEYLPNWTEKHQKYLNKFPQFKTNIQGLDIHFIHIKSSKVEGKKHFPVLLLHGWPGSVVEFYTFIDNLRRESVSFDIIVPSLPGYGFSQAAAKEGLSAVEMSVVLRNLMLRLGYEKFVIQGGDWGSIIGNNLATLFPENVIGYHSNFCLVTSPLGTIKTLIASLHPKAFIPEEYEDFVFPYLDKVKLMISESGYFHIQATKPDTIGTALTDNPIGLASYILEKFWAGHILEDHPDGGLAEKYPLDHVIHNLMFYALSDSMHTAARIYAETFSKRGMAHQLERVRTTVPSGCTRFKFDIGQAIDWVLQDKFTNFIHSTYHTDGGHFAALEVPDTLLRDFMSFVKKLE